VIWEIPELRVIPETREIKDLKDHRVQQDLKDQLDPLGLRDHLDLKAQQVRKGRPERPELMVKMDRTDWMELMVFHAGTQTATALVSLTKI
jgi:hypothetical protein